MPKELKWKGWSFGILGGPGGFGFVNDGAGGGSEKYWTLHFVWAKIAVFQGGKNLKKKGRKI